MEICVLRNSTLKDTESACAAVAAVAKRLGIRIVPERRAAAADLFLVLGGDGSVLHAVRAHGRRGIPFLGVNIGSLGYLAGTRPDGLEEALRAFRDGECELEERSLLRAQFRRGGNGRASAPELSLNDIVVSRSGTGRIVGLDLLVDGEEAASFLCDGILLATPTGSTAYSLSAGGPILLPRTPAFLVNVLCPHVLSSRPLVVPAESIVTIRVSRAEAPLLCSVDGQVRAELRPGDTITATTAAQTVKIVTLPGQSPFAPLRTKLGWKGSLLS